MINLRPESHINQLRAAQHNTLILKYIFLSLVTLVLFVGIHVFTYTILKISEDSSNSITEENKSKISEYTNIKQTAQKYKANLSTAKALLNQNVSYTTGLFNIAYYIPKNVILQNIDLSPESIGVPVTLTARAKSYNDGIKLKDSLIKSDITKDASLLNLIDERSNTNNGGDTGFSGIQKDYPFSVSINVIFNDKLFEPRSDTKKRARK